MWGVAVVCFLIIFHVSRMTIVYNVTIFQVLRLAVVYNLTVLLYTISQYFKCWDWLLCSIVQDSKYWDWLLCVFTVSLTVGTGHCVLFYIFPSVWIAELFISIRSVWGGCPWTPGQSIALPHFRTCLPLFLDIISTEFCVAKEVGRCGCAYI